MAQTRSTMVMALLVGLFSGSAFGEDSGQGLIERAVSILSPADGETFQSGQSVLITAEPAAHFDPDWLKLFSRIGLVELEGSPFTGTLEIPLHFIGRLELTIMARDAAGKFADSDTIGLIIEAPAELVSLSVEPTQLFLRSMRSSTYQWQIIVRGEFADGVTRHIESSWSGTSYESSDLSVVEVTSEGSVVPRGIGTATIVVRNGTAQDSVAVEVLELVNGEINPR